MEEEQKQKYRILANKTGEMSGWDFGKLEQELAEVDFGDFDFDFDLPDSGANETQVAEDEAPEVDEAAPPKAKLGDIWKCGTPLIEKLWNALRKHTVTRVAAVLVLLVLSTAYVVGSTNSPFLYFNF